MKKTILLFFVLANIGILSAQGNKDPNKAKIDSIEKLLKLQPQDDTIKVKRLSDLASFCFFSFQYEDGLKATTQARQLAQKLHYKKGEGMYLRTMSDFNLNSDLLIYYDRKARWFYADINQKEDLFHIDAIDSDSAAIEKAKAQLYEALKFYEKAQDKETIAQILYNIGLFNLWLKKPGEVVTYLDQSIKLFKEINQDGPAATVLSSKMNSLQKMGKAKEADEADSEVSHIISKLSNMKEAALVSFIRSNLYYNQGKKTQAFEDELKVDNQLEIIGDKQFRILVLGDLAVKFGFMAMSQKAFDYYKKAISLMEETKNYNGAVTIYFQTGFELVALNKLEEAKVYFSKAKDRSDKSNDPQVVKDGILRYADAMGQILMGQEKYKEALVMFNQAVDNWYVQFYKGYCYQKLGNLKEAIGYGEKSYGAALPYGDQKLIMKICLLLSEVYDRAGQPMKAYEYLKKYRSIIKERDEQDIANHSANLEIQAIIEKSQREKGLLEKEKLLKEKQNQNQRWWLISIAGALLSTFVVLFILFRNNQNKQKANALLHKQKEEIQDTLSQLKATQSQLIQSEKMASLGELTAGIAHEIQNPLNFINNFSEVNKELLIEMKDEIDKGNVAEVKSIADDVIENEEKINHHGKRADAIVKGMLQHSRAGSGTKEPTDINALADEYLRLSYHGLKAKDKTFNATLQTDFDEGIGKINIVPQDVGRVLLNLYNNAFYAVAEKKKQQLEGYKPTISVSTKRINDKSNSYQIEIRVKDNGNGIPQKVIEKIFQPFFTTKPTGQGTGLGLSLSYDIIKAHGGEIKVDSKEGEGSEFIIQLPIYS